MPSRAVTSWNWEHVRLAKAKQARLLLKQLRKDSNETINNIIGDVIKPLSTEEALALPNVVQVRSGAEDQVCLDVQLYTRHDKIAWLIKRMESNFEKQWLEKVGWPYQDVFDPFKFQRHIDDMRIEKAKEVGATPPERTIPAEGEKWERPAQVDGDDEDDDEDEDPRAQQNGAQPDAGGEKVVDFAQAGR